jgi:hypothetical protein
MKPPLRAEDHDKVTAEAILARGNDKSSCGRMDVGSFFGKDIDAFMGDRFAPGIGPKGILVKKDTASKEELIANRKMIVSMPGCNGNYHLDCSLSPEK